MGATSSVARKVVAVLFLALATVLAVTNFYLVRQNRQLRVLAAERQREAEPTVGVALPPLHGFDSKGKKLTSEYGYDPRKTLLFVLSPDCGVCTRNWPNWQAMLESLDEESYRFVFANLAGELTEDYLALYGFTEFPVFAELDPQSKIDYNLRFTPQTVLIAPDGIVEKVWTGMLNLNDERRREIEQTLGVKLPALE